MAETGTPAGSVVGLDIGGTGIKGARLTLGGDVVERLTVPTPVADGPAAVVRSVGDVARSLIRPDTIGVGLCTAGLVDPAAGVVRYAANLGFRDVPLARSVAELVDRPVTLDHDVRAACLAEQRLGRGRDAGDLVLVVLGTGLSAGMVVDGRIPTGALGFGGEIGHAPVHPDGELCPCGQRGCLEVYASASGIVRRYRAAGGAPEASAADIVAAVDDDPLAARVWTEATRALGHGLVTMTLLLDPAVIVLAGGLTGAGRGLLGPLTAAVADGLAWREPPELTISALGAEAPLHGAALRMLEAARPELRRAHSTLPTAAHVGRGR